MPVFGKSTPKRTIRSVINELVDRTNTNTQRLRILEQDIRTLKTRTNSIEKNTLNQTKKINSTLSKFEAKLTKTEDRILALERTIKEMVNEIKRLATLPKVKELEELIEIYNPLKSQFITKEEVERMIERKRR